MLALFSTLLVDLIDSLLQALSHLEDSLLYLRKGSLYCLGIVVFVRSMNHALWAYAPAHAAEAEV